MIISVTDRRQETQFLDRQTRRGPSTFGKALNVKDYGTRLFVAMLCSAIDLPQVYVVDKKIDLLQIDCLQN